MKVIHLIAGIDKTGGGTTEYILVEHRVKKTYRTTYCCWYHWNQQRLEVKVKF
jgi:hypothetical protein